VSLALKGEIRTPTLMIAGFAPLRFRLFAGPHPDAAPFRLATGKTPVAPLVHYWI